ncbi:flagellar hook assembly protein FlgD [Lysobacter niastensis]|uniref:Basal-body rod modification protein FlgD n=1 Tax=Lysobacter niastensis TaxID=380629 RepID=A0ABS0B9A1_9GAMM|nr:flagellar hook capping FlgD N-terminal domain-containing protein [Lysobacter niastensis]MBF6025588.1 flagellar hook assembly protein FlgD [Lysobacter niastensis]
MSTVNTDNTFSNFGAAAQSARKENLGQADFLKLMTEQLKHQDPLKPLDNNQFLGQLAQFSTVQGIESMQGAMNAMASVMESDQTLRAAALVGRNALIEASEVQLAAGATLTGEVTAPAAGPVQIEIVDASGAVVRKQIVQADAKGTLDWQWDGRDDAGKPIAAGNYEVRAIAGTGDDAEALEVRLSTRVDSVSIGPTGLELNLSGVGSHPLSSIRRIS